ncbi:hypothetical protein NP493_180g07002 [Ridgeia piscesae]|uniref:Bacterial surface antigen (D15) domain-containing protein n=1 Tax=Ridgeia piscesae TaxID=27915 RepID=A0AAD9UF49_RIDPI|nr:hypothetical protein NP493_180g07002 [Ridgeia piscesae]
MFQALSSDIGDSLKRQPLPSNEKDIVLSLVPVKVEHVHVDGVTRTQNDILKTHIKDIFTADNFEDMVKKAHVARNKLDKLGLFKSIEIFIDTSKGSTARTDGYDITFLVKEHRRVTGGISTLIGTNEGSMLFNLKLPNTFGRAEKLNMEYMYGTKKATGYNLLFSKPLQGDPNLRLQAGVFQHSGEFPWSGYKELDRGLSFDLSYPTLLGRHNIRWEGVWRDITCLTDNPSFAVREHAGHSVKSALRHTWIRDKRDSTVMPTTGYCIELTQEIAGLGGDAKYVRHETEFQANKLLWYGTVVQLSLAGGIMKTIQPGGNIRINDRFFLGGPLTLRGYEMKGVGPRDAGSVPGRGHILAVRSPPLHTSTLQPGQGRIWRSLPHPFLCQCWQPHQHRFEQLMAGQSETVRCDIPVELWSWHGLQNGRHRSNGAQLRCTTRRAAWGWHHQGASVWHRSPFLMIIRAKHFGT